MGYDGGESAQEERPSENGEKEDGRWKQRAKGMKNSEALKSGGGLTRKRECGRGRTK